jgi:hypothetical protein
MSLAMSAQLSGLFYRQLLHRKVNTFLPENSKDKNSKFAISTKISRDSGPIDYDDLSKAFIIKKLKIRFRIFVSSCHLTDWPL